MPHDPDHCKDCRVNLADHGTRCASCARSRACLAAPLIPGDGDLVWDADGTCIDQLSYELTADDLGVTDMGAVSEALKAAGYSASEYSGGGLYVPVEDGEQSDGSEVDGTPALKEIRAIVEPFGLSAEWSGDSNTDSDGDTTSDIVID